MILTPELINLLAADLRPVRRLRSPLLRAFAWLLLATVILALIAVGQGVRPDITQCLADLRFDFAVAGALLTGLLAAVSAFQLSVPDRSQLWLLLPTPALLLWLSSVGYQCLVNWVAFDPGALRAAEAARCLATLVLTGFPLSLALLFMLRRAALVRPTAVKLVGSLAIAGLTAAALLLIHVADASVMILMWNLGTAVLFLGLGSAFGRRLFAAIAPRATVHF